MDNRQKKGIALAVCAAALYAINTPLSKLLLNDIPSTLLAGLLYLGAGLGMLLVWLFRRCTGKAAAENLLSRAELPYTIAMIVLDIAAPVFLMAGLTRTTAANASLLGNFEIVATAVIALCFFCEAVSRRLWLGIFFVTASCALLSFEDLGSFRFSVGSLFVLLAAVCWGVENNCTRKLSDKDPMEIVLLKGVFSGSAAVLIGLGLGERTDSLPAVLCALLVGLVAYGFSIFVYVYAQRLIGAARTSAYYAVAPFIGSALSLLLFREIPKVTFLFAILLMAAGAYLSSRD